VAGHEYEKKTQNQKVFSIATSDENLDENYDVGRADRIVQSD
jgi:hypothetical protein